MFCPKCGSTYEFCCCAGYPRWYEEKPMLIKIEECGLIPGTGDPNYGIEECPGYTREQRIEMSSDLLIKVNGVEYALYVQQGNDMLVELVEEIVGRELTNQEVDWVWETKVGERDFPDANPNGLGHSQQDRYRRNK